MKAKNQEKAEYGYQDMSLITQLTCIAYTQHRLPLPEIGHLLTDDVEVTKEASKSILVANRTFKTIAAPQKTSKFFISAREYFPKFRARSFSSAQETFEEERKSSVADDEQGFSSQDSFSQTFLVPWETLRLIERAFEPSPPLDDYSDDQMTFQEVCFDGVYSACLCEQWKKIDSHKDLLTSLTNRKGESLLFRAIDEFNLITWDNNLFKRRNERILTIVENLLKYKIGLEQADHTGATPLHFAARIGFTAVIPLLLQNGFRINGKNEKTQSTPLHEAVLGDQCETVAFLLQQRASVEEVMRYDELMLTPPMLCAYLGLEECFKVFVDNLPESRKTFIFSQNNPKTTILHVAIMGRHTPLLHHLFMKYPEQMKTLLNMPDEEGRTPRQLANFMGIRRIVDSLLVDVIFSRIFSPLTSKLISDLREEIMVKIQNFSNKRIRELGEELEELQLASKSKKKKELALHRIREIREETTNILEKVKSIWTKLIEQASYPILSPAERVFAQKALHRTLDKRIKPPSPIEIMSYIYRIAKSSRERQACLWYLLHYQHYNAEFTVSENHLLGYRTPLSAAQRLPRYIRNDPQPLYELSESWIKRSLARFFGKSYVNHDQLLNCVEILSRSSIDILSKFYRKERNIVDLRSNQDINIKQNNIFFIEIRRDDLGSPLTNNAIKILESVFKERFDQIKQDNVYFIFYLEIEHSPCVLMWGVKWSTPKENNDLECLKLNRPELFGKKVFSELNQAGAVPDRMEVNNFLIQDLPDEEFSEALGLIGITGSFPTDGMPDEASIDSIHDQWRQLMQVMQEIDFCNPAEGRGCELYRKAILKWNYVLFQRYRLPSFISLLLCSQVAPWISKEATLVEWSKAYQNLCEIVMFCLQAFPNNFSDVDFIRTICTYLGKEALREISASVGLFSYGMTSIFYVFDKILERPDIRNKPVKIACINRNYFETVELVRRIQKTDRINIQQAEQLQKLKSVPDILIIDIHPNNAKSEESVQNPVDSWIKECLIKSPSKKIILILDITLNQLTDFSIQDTLQSLRPFIAKGQLEIFLTQSLAKLVQLGADNFSGGLCMHLRNSDPVVFPDIIPQKGVFFSLLFSEFQEEIRSYIKQVRQNTSWMHDKLKASIAKIYKTVLTKGEVQQNFCAANVSFNGDDNTVYIAVNFQPVLNLLKVKEGVERETIVRKLRKLILDLAHEQSLFITGRQSFGFSLTNMNLVVDVIRLTIGLETYQQLEKYVGFFSDFFYLLSNYVAECHTGFNLEQFAIKITKTYRILNGSEEFIPVTVSFKPRDLSSMDEDQEPPSSDGVAQISFTNLQLNLKIFPDKNLTYSFDLPQRKITGINSTIYPSHWSFSRLLKLLFRLSYLDHSFIYVSESLLVKNTYAICNFIPKDLIVRSWFPHFITDTRSGIEIVLTDSQPDPILEVSQDSTHFSCNQIYIKDPEKLGSVPIKFNKLDRARRKEVLQKCVYHHLELTPHKKEGYAILSFSEKQEGDIGDQKRLIAIVDDVFSDPNVEQEKKQQASETVFPEFSEYDGDERLLKIQEDLIHCDPQIVVGEQTQELNNLYNALLDLEEILPGKESASHSKVRLIESLKQKILFLFSYKENIQFSANPRVESGRLIFASFNQFSQQEARSSCAANAVNFARCFFSLEKMEEVDQKWVEKVTSKGMEIYVNLLERREKGLAEVVHKIREEAATKKAEELNLQLSKMLPGKEKEEFRERINSLIQQAIEAAEKQFRQQQGGGHLAISEVRAHELFRSLAVSTTPPFTENLPRKVEDRAAYFYSVLENIATEANPRLVLTLTCNGYTHAVGIVRAGKQFYYVIYDSHGKQAINNNPHAFCSIHHEAFKAAQYLAHLVVYLSFRVQKAGINEITCTVFNEF